MSISLINITIRDDGDDNADGQGGVDPADDDDNEDEDNHDHDHNEMKHFQWCCLRRKLLQTINIVLHKIVLR